MLDKTNDNMVLAHLQSYYNLLKKTGYISDKMTFRYLLYLFLYDFTESLYDFFTDCDYKKVNRLLVSIFSDGGCLLPYTNFVHDHIKVGTPRYEGFVTKRITEDLSGNEDRITENGYQRVKE